VVSAALNIILLQTTRSALYLTGIKNGRKAVFGAPQCFELPLSMRGGRECDDIPLFAKFVRDCTQRAKLTSNKIVFCLEDDNMVSKEYQHLPCSRKSLLAFARLEAEAVLQNGIDDYMIQNYEYNRPNAVTGKLTSSLFAVKGTLLDRIRKDFSKCGFHVIKIVPPMSGLLYVGKTLIDSQNKTVAVLDFGYEKTHLIILQNGLPVFQRTFETIYDDIIEILMKEKAISFQEAVGLVDAYGFFGEASPAQTSESAKQISLLLDTSVNEAIRNIRMVISSERMELNKLILCGGLSAVPGFTEFCDNLGLDIPLESIDTCVAANKLPEMNAAAKRRGCRPAAFVTAAGLLKAKKTDDIDFLNMIRAKSDARAVNISVLALVTVLALGVMALEPILYKVALRQQAQDQVSLSDVKYDELKSLLQQQSGVSAQLSKMENDSKLLPAGKSKAEETVKQLFDQVFAKAKAINSCDIDNTAGSIALVFQTANYNDYLTVKHSVEANGYFEIAIPFHAEAASDGSFTCSVVLNVKGFVPINPNSKGGDAK